MTAAKAPTVPAATRPAFDAALHLMILEPARFPYREMVYAGAGQYHLFVNDPPAPGTPKAQREAFYDAPDMVADAKQLAAMVREAGVMLPGDGFTIEAASAIRAGKTWRVLSSAGELAWVGKTYADARQVMGMPEPVPVDYASLPPMRVGAVTIGTADAAAIEEARERQRVSIGEEAHRRRVTTDEVCADRGLSPAIMGDDAVRIAGVAEVIEHLEHKRDAATIADVAAEHLGEPSPAATGQPRRQDGKLAPKPKLPRRRPNETAHDHAQRAAAELGRPVYVSRGFHHGTPARAKLEPPTGRPWHAYLPDGTDIACGYGRTSKRGQEGLRKVAERMAAWRKAQEQAPPEPEPIPAGPEPLADVVPIRADVVDPYGRTVAAVDLDTATTDMHNTAQQQADEPEPVPAPTPVATIGHTALGQLPPAAEEWLARLIHPPKRTYARAYLEHLANGAPPPADPGDEWARKARTRAQRILNH